MPGNFEDETLSVIIPVYNEANTVATLLDKVAAVRIPRVKLEILCINDGSNDGSTEIIRQWQKEHRNTDLRYFEKPNGGKGSAVRLGIRHSTGKYVIIQDADLEYDPNDYAKCIDPIRKGECSVVYGSREDANRNRLYSSPIFYLGALSLTLWINLLFNSNLTDEATCYKTFEGDLIRSLPFDGERFEWEPEITAKLLRLGCEIHEVGVSYFPRKKNQGKKIRFKDALHSFKTAFKWRFKPMTETVKKVAGISEGYAKQIRNVRYAYLALAGIVILACLARILYAIPGMENPDLLMRPDSATYLAPAQSIFSSGEYLGTDGTPTALRTPGYPLFLGFTLWISNSSLAFAALCGALTGGLTCGILYCAARLYGSWKTAFASSLLFALNPTAIALSPMFISDTLFTLLVACSLLFFLKFARSRFALFFMASVFFAALGAMTRPVNLLWIAPAVFVLFCMKNMPVRLKTYYAFFGILIFAAVTFPWFARNASIGAGFRLDAVSANAMMHNASALESSITGENGEAVRNRYELEMANRFSDEPEKFATPAQRLSYQEKTMASIIAKHPFRYLAISLRPYVLLPDIPSFLENLGLTQTGRGTFDVLNREGIISAVNHYFGGSYLLPALCAPLIAATLITYILAFTALCILLMRRDWTGILIFLLFSLYYIVMPGPVAMPRYTLPALPFISILAAFTLGIIAKIYTARHRKTRSLTCR